MANIQPGSPTTTLNYWKLEEHPFRDTILRGESLRLFVDRDDEIFDMEDYLTYSRVIGVHGSLGVGKSSFLQKLAVRAKSQKITMISVHLTADSRETFYREILRQVLLTYKKGEFQLKSDRGMNIDNDLVRLDASVTNTLGSTVEGSVYVAKGKFDKSSSTKTDIHTESTAISKLVTIFSNLKSRIIVVLDDFEKLQYGHPHESRNYIPLLSRFISTMEEKLSHDLVSFIISLDDQFTDLVQKAKQRGGALSFALDDLVVLKNLHPQQVVDMVSIRIKNVGWEKTMADFLPLESFWVLSLASQNHPRRVLKILAEAMKIITKYKRPLQIDHPTLSEACKNNSYNIDELDLKIIVYLAKSGGASESDSNFLKAVGLRSRSSLAKRLSYLKENIHLQTKKVRSAKTNKIIYSLPEISI